MFASQGFSLLTFLVVIGGIIVHSLKQFNAARTNGAALSIRSYILDHRAETITSVIGSLVLWAGLPEISEMFPEFASTIGLDGEVGVVSSFICGFVGNSVADVFGGRARTIGG